MFLVHRNHNLKASNILLGVTLWFAWACASAQPVEVPPTWGGDFWSRPRLTGNWGGLRDELGKKGVVFDVDLLVTPMGVLSGGRNTGGNTWGNVDYTLNGATSLAMLYSSATLATTNPYFNPRPVTRESVRALLDDAWHARRPA